MKKLLFLLLLLCLVSWLSACAYSTRVPYQVDSTPSGARIYVNGVSMGIAPVQIELACDKFWRCPANGPCSWEFSGYEYKVTAHPAEDNTDLSQTKRVDPCQLKASRQIHFDVGSGEVVSRPADVDQHDNNATVADTGLTPENLGERGAVH